MPSADASERAILGYFCLQIVSMTFLQKFGTPVLFSFPILIGCLAVMVARGYALISPARLLLYGIFCLATLVSQMFVGRGISAGAVLLFLLMYAPIVFYFEVSEELYRRGLLFFQHTMVVIFGIVVYQVVSQELVGVSAWPNMNKLPGFMQVSPGFNYFRETGYMTGKYQPNAIFFLEPSFVSQFFALAIMIELVWFRSFWRLAVFAGGVILSLAGSGLLILALAAPFLAAKLPIRALLALCGAILVAAVAATAVGWTEQAGKRAGEFVTPNTSGYIRYTEPALRIVERLKEPESIYTGLGGGSSVVDTRTNVLPVSKALNEYGLLQTLSFFALFLFGLFAGTPSKRIAVGFFLYFFLGGGGLTVPVYALLCILFCAQFRIRQEEVVAARARSPALPPRRMRATEQTVAAGP